MTRSETLTEEDLSSVAGRLGLADDEPDPVTTHQARQRVDADEASARASGVRYTPTFFINGRRYDGPWDEVSLSDAMLNTLGHRVRAAALFSPLDTLQQEGRCAPIYFTEGRDRRLHVGEYFPPDGDEVALPGEFDEAAEFGCESHKIIPAW
jgi:hypothetical protein